MTLRTWSVLSAALAVGACNRLPTDKDSIDTDTVDTVDTDTVDTVDTDTIDTNDTDTTVDTDEPYDGPGLLATIREIRDGSGGFQVNDLVAVRSVVVTAVGTRGFYVQDPAEDQWGGINIYTNGTGAVPTVGDVIDVVGEYEEYAPDATAVPPNETTAEIAVLSAITDSGWTLRRSGAAVPVVDVTVDAMSAVATAEPYESMLVRLAPAAGLEVLTDPAVGFSEFDVSTDGTFARARIDNELFSLAANLEGVLPGATFDTITGTVIYSFNQHKVAPRSLADQTGFEAAAPDTDTDLGGAVTLPDLRQGTLGIPVGSIVLVQDLVVTATDTRGFYAQDPTGAPWGGIYVYTNGDLAAPAQWSHVNVVGQYAEYSTSGGTTPLTTQAELIVRPTVPGTSFTVVSAGTAIAPIVVDVDTMGVIATAEPYEAMFVRLQDVEPLAIVSDPAQNFGEFDVSVSTTTNDARIDQQIFSLPNNVPGFALGGTFPWIQGPVVFSFGEHKVAPRTIADAGAYLPPGVVDTDTDSDTDLPVDTDTDTDLPTTPELHAVRDGSAGVQVGDIVTVRDLVVTGSDRRGFFVQEELAQAYGGIYVYTNGDLTAPARWSRVTVTGQLEEYSTTGGTAPFATQAELIVRPSVAGTSFVNHGVGPAVDPLSVDLATMASATTAEPYEAMFVRLQDTQRLDVVTDPAANFGEFDVSTAASADAAIIDQQIFDLPANLPGFAVGASFRWVQGPVYFSFGEHKVAPRDLDDQAFYLEPGLDTASFLDSDTDTDLPVDTDTDTDLPVDTDTDTDLPVDTDTDTDLPAPPTLHEVRDGSAGVVSGDLVTVTGLVVTGADRRGFFVQEEGAPPYGGAYVYTNGDLPAPARWSRVDVTGSFTEYTTSGGTAPLGTTAELIVRPSVPGTSFVDLGVGAPVDPLPVTLAMMGSAATAEPYEGMLVRLEEPERLEVLNDPATSFGEFDVSTASSTDVAIVDQQIFDLPATLPGFAIGASFRWVQGPVVFSFGEHKVAPRDLDDQAWYLAPGLDTASFLDSDTDTDLAVDTDTDTDLVVDTDTDTDLAVDTDTDTDLVVDTDTDLVVDTDTDTDLVVDTDTDADTDVVVDTDTDTDVVDTDVVDTDTDTDQDTDLTTVALSDLGPGDLLITEIMANPNACSDNDGEYFEILVAAQVRVDLGGLQMSDRSGTDTLSGSWPVQQGDRLVVALSNTGIVGCYGVNGAIDWSRSLNNSGGDAVTIANASGTIDTVDYGSWTLQAGVSFERDDDDPAIWCDADQPIAATADLGSPGMPNGSCFAVDTDLDSDTDTDLPGPLMAIADVRGGAVATGSLVTVDGVVVAVSPTKGFALQDPMSATYGGIFVYDGGGTQPALGDRVRATGRYAEYDGSTEHGAPGVSLAEVITLGTAGGGFTVVGPGSVPTATVVDLATFATDADLYESMRVELVDTDVLEVLTDPAASFGEFDVAVTGTVAPSARIDNEFMDLASQLATFSVGDTFTSLRGVVYYSFGTAKVGPVELVDGVGYVDAAP
ncbi:MAG: hypothetical protein H6733_00915 [Alphaproteobacteria bacterium]|nr:hypothetical protein [Alphaproteobacteria bacterium]